MTAFARAASLFAAACLAGCVLFVPDRGDLGLTCRFAGDDATACGKCLATHCQAKVDGCCADANCQAGVADLDTCSLGGGCRALTQRASTNGKLADLSLCLSSSCDSVCSASPVDGGGTDVTPSGPVLCNSGTGANGRPNCLCVAVSVPIGGSGSCSPSSLSSPTEGTLCCADDAYPGGANSICSCDAIQCDTPVSGSCTCGTDVHGSVLSCSAQTGWVCCNSTTTEHCYCTSSPGACGKDFVDMGPTCSAPKITCPTGKHKVSSCS